MSEGIVCAGCGKPLESRRLVRRVSGYETESCPSCGCEVSRRTLSANLSAQALDDTTGVDAWLGEAAVAHGLKVVQVPPGKGPYDYAWSVAGAPFPWACEVRYAHRAPGSAVVLFAAELEGGFLDGEAEGVADVLAAHGAQLHGLTTGDARGVSTRWSAVQAVALDLMVRPAMLMPVLTRLGAAMKDGAVYLQQQRSA